MKHKTAYNQTEAKEKEQAILLSISQDISSIRDSQQLFRVMTERLVSYIQFDHAVIITLDKDKKQYLHLFSTLHQGSGTYSPVTGTMSQMIADGHYSICSTTELIKKNPGFTGLEALERKGIREIMAVPLRYASDIIGFLMLYSKATSAYTHENSEFILSITHQLSVAVSNILAYEELKQKTIEIERLNRQLKAQNDYLIEEVEQEYNFEEMIGQNPAFSETCKNIGLVARTDSTVLIMGETGTGKELVARAIHNHSLRKNKPLIKLNCAALPANLIESELFGHERGAFTGATDRRIGKFELAHNSTLFLDEIGELPLELQSKLLRALQEKEIERLGSNKTIHVDVRIIAATNRDLTAEVNAGKFRQDLYYRLYIFPITLPPLRERREDIPLLADHFIKKYAKKIGRHCKGLSEKAMKDLINYTWPGNIRELEHTIERSVILCSSRLIKSLDLPENHNKRPAGFPANHIVKTWKEQEREYILEILKITKGNITGKGGAAELLQLRPTTLQSKMLKLGIKRKHYIEQ